MAQHKESFVRWQSIAVEQLGYAVGLVLSFAAASLGFALNIVKDPNYIPGCQGKVLMLLSTISLIFSLGVGVWCVINRLKDFRETRSIAKDRESWEREKVPEDEIDRRLEARRTETRKIGDLTWTLFHWQIGTFALGVVMLIGSFVAVYHSKVF